MRPNHTIPGDIPVQRIPQLTGLRGLAISAVLVHHFFRVKLLWMGVDLFFILSGFLITNVLLNAKRQGLRSYLGHFYARRGRRLLLPYLLSLLLVGVLFGVAWIKYWYLYGFLANLLLPLNIPHPLAFDPLWSLAVEEQFYLAWPFVVFYLEERSLKWAATFLVILAPFLRAIFHFQTPWAIYTSTPFRMDLLACGALLCLLYRGSRAGVERLGLVIGIVCTSMGLSGLLILSRLGVTTYTNSRTGNVWIYESTLFCCLGVMLWALGGKAVGVLCWKPLMYIGQISYTVYLIHLGIFTFIRPYFSLQFTAFLAFFTCIGYATVSWIVLEEPILSAGHFSRSVLSPKSAKLP